MDRMTTNADRRRSTAKGSKRLGGSGRSRGDSRNFGGGNRREKKDKKGKKNKRETQGR
jgi:hypothetical protein